jgi:hypothetical protein
MGMRRLSAVNVAISLALLDLVMTLLAFGWYGQPEDHFDMSRIRGCLEAPYDFRTSLFDLFLLSVLRVSILLGGVLGVLRNAAVGVERAKSVQLAVICLVMLMWAFSPTKLLGLAEIDANMRNIGCWISLIWNVVASVGLVFVWKFVVCGLQVKGSNAVNAAKETVPLFASVSTKNGHVPSDNAKDERKKVELPKLHKETFAHIGRLLQYCKAEWVWYSLGFVFLFVCSAGTFLIFCHWNTGLIAWNTARISIPYYTGQAIANIVVTKSYSELLKCVFIVAGLSVIR